MTLLHRPHRLRNAGLALAVLGSAFAAASVACLSPGPSRQARTTEYEAGGVFARHLRLRIAPSHTQAFERLMELCVEVAEAHELSEAYSWLCYREPPGRYWLILFSSTEEGFAVPPGLEGFVSSFAGLDPRGAELMAVLAGLEHEVEWELVCRQKESWSTIDDMDTKTHPEARMILRRVRPGREAEFEAALDARTALFRDAGYPLPIEGFVIRGGLPGHTLQVVFPVDWPSYHAGQSFFAYFETLSEARQVEYAARKAALMPTMASAEYYDASHAPELSR